MNDTTFPNDRQSFAKLSKEELESFGKQAAIAYMSSECSLNDAIIKIARQHPSISSHQVKRIAEYANQETFSRLFSDDAKTAGDKNIEFPVADPGEILQTLNMQAEPDRVTLPDSDFHCGPVKTASVVKELEADVALAREFGFDPVSPGTEVTVITKIATDTTNDQFAQRILGTKEKQATPADRILAAGEEGISGDTGSALSQDMVPDVARQESEEEAAIKEGFDRKKALGLGAGVLGAGALGYWASKAGGPGSVGDKAEIFNQAMELYSKETGNPPEQMAEDSPYKWINRVQGKAKTAMGGPEGMLMNAQPQQHPEITHRENMRGMERRVEIEKKKQELVAMQQKGMTAPGDQGGAPEPGGAPPGMAPPPGGAPQGGPPPQGMAPGGAPPPGAGGPPPQGAPSPIPPPQLQKMSSLMDEALLYAKMGRPMTDQVVSDLSEAVSIDKIKEAAANRYQYPMANPFGELHRMQQKLSHVCDEARVARDRNEYLLKEAEANFLHSVNQHVLGGGNLGELIHACQSVPGNDIVIEDAMAKAAQQLADRNIDPDKLRGEMLPYEIEKSASIRAPNPDHPVLSALGTFCKLASNQPVLNLTAARINSKYQEVEEVLTRAIQHARSA